jgi:hypothetical protein
MCESDLSKENPKNVCVEDAKAAKRIRLKPVPQLTGK